MGEVNNLGGWLTTRIRPPCAGNGATRMVVIVAGRPFAVMGFAVVKGKSVEIDAIAEPKRLRRIAAAILTEQ